LNDDDDEEEEEDTTKQLYQKKVLDSMSLLEEPSVTYQDRLEERAQLKEQLAY
jgi:hypothetical protein